VKWEGQSTCNFDGGAASGVVLRISNRRSAPDSSLSHTERAGVRVRGNCTWIGGGGFGRRAAWTAAEAALHFVAHSSSCLRVFVVNWFLFFKKRGTWPFFVVGPSPIFPASGMFPGPRKGSLL